MCFTEKQGSKIKKDVFTTCGFSNRKKALEKFRKNEDLICRLKVVQYLRTFLKNALWYLSQMKIWKNTRFPFYIFIYTQNVSLILLSKQSNRLWRRQALNTQKLIETIEPFNDHWCIKICPTLNFKTNLNDSETELSIILKTRQERFNNKIERKSKVSNANYGILVIFWRFCIQLHWALDHIFSSNLLLLFHVKDYLPNRQGWFCFNELRHRRNHICTIPVVGEVRTA